MSRDTLPLAENDVPAWVEFLTGTSKYVHSFDSADALLFLFNLNRKGYSAPNESGCFKACPVWLVRHCCRRSPGCKLCLNAWLDKHHHSSNGRISRPRQH